ncbi:MAG: NAD(P)H-hydrate dehydratase [Planctomycetia bacterium]|nr:NAD(P)H-hydrate dehydratase [Planctomycetia bacterium]
MPHELPPDFPRFSKRKPDSHKGTFGTGLCVGGSVGMAGSIGLAGTAMLRVGAGLAQLAVPRSILSTVAGYEPSYMTVPLVEDAEGRIAGEAIERVLELGAKATALAVGPGLGRSAELNRFVARLFSEFLKSAVFDADALNALADQPDVFAGAPGARILTPHPGEFRRLIGGRDPGPRAAFVDEAVKLAARTRAVIVLKGSQTVVTDGERSYVNRTGNPGMATGGTGDTLTGIITGLLCQGFEPFDAARLGVFIHGRAGDLAAAEVGEPSLLPTDILRHLPSAIRELTRPA